VSTNVKFLIYVYTLYINILKSMNWSFSFFSGNTRNVMPTNNNGTTLVSEP